MYKMYQYVFETSLRWSRINVPRIKSVSVTSPVKELWAVENFFCLDNMFMILLL